MPERKPKPRIMPYVPAADRYDRMLYRRCGRSGLKLPAISLGLWHSFGGDTAHETKRALIRTAFDAGINFIDSADAYNGGQSEVVVGRAISNSRQPAIISHSTTPSEKMSDR